MSPSTWTNRTRSYTSMVGELLRKVAPSPGNGLDQLGRACSTSALFFRLLLLVFSVERARTSDQSSSLASSASTSSSFADPGIGRLCPSAAMSGVVGFCRERLRFAAVVRSSSTRCRRASRVERRRRPCSHLRRRSPGRRQLATSFAGVHGAASRSSVIALPFVTALRRRSRELSSSSHDEILRDA